MDEKEYDQIAERLENRLNEKGTLILFTVAFASTYKAEFGKGFDDDAPLDHFVVRHKIKIGERQLIGFRELSHEMISDSATDILDVVCQDAAKSIANIILHPQEIRVGKIETTNFSNLPYIS